MSTCFSCRPILAFRLFTGTSKLEVIELHESKNGTLHLLTNQAKVSQIPLILSESNGQDNEALCAAATKCLDTLLVCKALQGLEVSAIMVNCAQNPGQKATNFESDALAEGCWAGLDREALRSPQLHASQPTADGPPSTHKCGLAEQKQNTEIATIAKFFNQPINAAGRQLNICPTLLKRICRQHNINRWPYRKLQHLERSLSQLEETLRETGGAAGHESFTAELMVKVEVLKQHRDTYLQLQF